MLGAPPSTSKSPDGVPVTTKSCWLNLLHLCRYKKLLSISSPCYKKLLSISSPAQESVSATYKSRKAKVYRGCNGGFGPFFTGSTIYMNRVPYIWNRVYKVSTENLKDTLSLKLFSFVTMGRIVLGPQTIAWSTSLLSKWNTYQRSLLELLQVSLRFASVNSDVTPDDTLLCLLRILLFNLKKEKNRVSIEQTPKNDFKLSANLKSNRWKHHKNCSKHSASS